MPSERTSYHWTGAICLLGRHAQGQGALGTHRPGWTPTTRGITYSSNDENLNRVVCVCVGAAKSREADGDGHIGCAVSRLGVVEVFKSFVFVCVGTQCVPSVATRVMAKMYRPIFFIHHVRNRGS